MSNWLKYKEINKTDIEINNKTKLEEQDEVP